MGALPDPRSSYALLIGVENYHARRRYQPLPTCRSSARRLAELMRDQELMWRLPPDRVELLGDRDGTAVDVTAQQARVALYEATMRPELEGGALLVCVSCHGHRFPNDGRYPRGLHLAMSDAHPGVPGTFLRFKEIEDMLAQAKRIKHRLLIIDACYANDLELRDSQGRVSAAPVDHLAIPGVVVLTATKYEQEACPRWGDTPWTAFLGATIETIQTGIRGYPETLTAVDVFTGAERLIDRADTQHETIPEPSIYQRGLSDIPLCRNEKFVPPHPAVPGPAAVVTFDDAESCFAAIEAAQADGNGDRIGGLVAGFCNQAGVRASEVAQLIARLTRTEFAGYAAVAYSMACQGRPASGITELAHCLHLADAPADVLLVTALHGRHHAGQVAAELYHRLLGSGCPECKSRAHQIAAQIIADAELVAEALAARPHGGGSD